MHAVVSGWSPRQRPPDLSFPAVAFQLAFLAVLFSYVQARERRVARLHPGDATAMSLLALLTHLHRDRQSWFSAPVIRSRCRELLDVALLVQSDLACPGRSASWRLRAQLRDEGLRIAEVFRAVEVRLAGVSGADAVDDVIRELAAGLALVLEGDRAALLSAAPPAASLRARIGARTRAMAPGLVLITAGCVALVLPLKGDSHTTAMQSGAYLVILGLVMLATTSTEVYSRVAEAFARTVHWRQ
ncbi:hypothetical protein [Streptomyces sp. NPDC001843]|uniref:hypothetical protein n=1 Tax=Streptomyces sp. NPDC001843 TaxID=3364617 RepID=UPI00368741C9